MKERLLNLSYRKLNVFLYSTSGCVHMCVCLCVCVCVWGGHYILIFSEALGANALSQLGRGGEKACSHLFDSIYAYVVFNMETSTLTSLP